MGRYSTALSVVVALLVFCYFVIFATACPSPELIRAIALEVIVFVIVLAIRFKTSRSKSAKLENLVLNELSQKWSLLKFSRNFVSGVVLVFWSVAVLWLSIDLIALTAAWSSNFSLARAIYTAFPASPSPAIHPAYSMEVLTGAYIQAGKYKRARELTTELIAIRKQLFGIESEQYAGIIADSAMLYRKEGNLKAAEEASLQALALSRQLLKNSGIGQIITQVAGNLRDQGKYAQAEELYKEALAMREKQFGTGSRKAAETLTEYAKLLTTIGKSEQAAVLENRVQQIARLQEKKKVPFQGMALTVVLLGVSLLGSRLLFGPRGYLTRMAIKRLENNVAQSAISTAGVSGASAAVSAVKRDDLQKLITFYQHQKNTVQVERYEIMLRELAAE